MPPARPIIVPQLMKRLATTAHVLPKLLDRFQEQIVANQAALESNLAKSELETFAAVVHSLKGSAGYLAAEQLYELAGRLESSSKAGDLNALRTGMDELRREVDQCLHHIPVVRQQITAQ